MREDGPEMKLNPHAPVAVSALLVHIRETFGIVAAAGALLIALATTDPATAQKPGGVLRMPIGDSPASMSIHEEATRIAVTPMMAVFNNLVLFDQHVAQNTFESIRPELAE